jgi:predicted phosphate transport protein (TIGR00153 family)
MAFGILKKQLGLQKQLDEFLNQVSEASLLLRQGVDLYLSERDEAFDEKLEQITHIEHRGDEMRRDIEKKLYIKTLIPESRGDVLQLLERLDTLLDSCKAMLWQFKIELPDFPEEAHGELRDLTSHSAESVEAIVRSTRAFLRTSPEFADHIHKVSYWETESDKVSTRMLMAIFRRDDLSLCHKAQLKDFVRRISKIADRAEDVADRLSIYAIKRML